MGPPDCQGERLLYADFDAAVHGIVAQPFLLKATVDWRLRRHVPDFLLVDEQGLVVVDVKPSARLSNRKVFYACWRYEIWSEPPATELGNVRFLAGFRNPRCFDRTLVESIRRRELAGRTLGEALSSKFNAQPALVLTVPLVGDHEGLDRRWR